MEVNWGSAKELVSRLSGTPPVSIIVNNEDAAANEPRVQVHEFMTRAFVRVSVQSEKRNVVRCDFGNGILDLATNEMNPFARPPCRGQISLHNVQRGLGNACAGRLACEV